MDKHVWEGWTVGLFINDLDPFLKMVIDNNNVNMPKTKKELKKWCMENQPYYKKHIPEVVEFFSEKYNLK